MNVEQYVAPEMTSVNLELESNILNGSIGNGEDAGADPEGDL